MSTASGERVEGAGGGAARDAGGPAGDELAMGWSDDLHTDEPPGRPGRAEFLFIGSVALFAVIGAWIETAYSARSTPPVAGAVALTLVASSALLLRRRRPITVAALVLAATVGYHLLGYDGLAPAFLLFVACYALPLHAGRRGMWLGLGVAAVAWAAPAMPPDALPWYAFDVSIPALALGAAALVGESARRRRAEARERARRSAVLAEEHTARRLAEERLVIARELHDVLAHTISVVAVQTGLALDALDDDPAQARAALEAVRGAARQAMPELRAALDLLRGGETARLRPQPDLDRLPELIGGFTDSGLAVELECGVSEWQDVPALVQLTAYRIVQESLTNALRHAAADRAVVTLRRLDDQMEVEVVDNGRALHTTTNGPGAAAQTSTGRAHGFGLVGMRERVDAVGGELEFGPRESGGFRVAARLPLHPHTTDAVGGAL